MQTFEAKLQKGGFDSLDSMLTALSLIEACDDSTAREARMAACAVANDCQFSLLPRPHTNPCCLKYLHVPKTAQQQCIVYKPPLLENVCANMRTAHMHTSCIPFDLPYEVGLVRRHKFGLHSLIQFLGCFADCAKRIGGHLMTVFKLFQAVFDFMDSEKLSTAGMT